MALEAHRVPEALLLQTRYTSSTAGSGPLPAPCEASLAALGDEQARPLKQVQVDASDEVATLAKPDAQPITARLAGAGSLRQELEALLTVASPTASPAELRELLLKDNVAGKGSAAARMWAWKRLKLRYVLDPAVDEYRAFVAEMRTATSPNDRDLLCFLMFARCDRLFREVTLECISPHLTRDGVTIETGPVAAAVQARAAASGLDWSAKTLDRAHKHLLAALKDFGILRGSLKKQTVRPRPGLPAVRFAARLARLEGLTDRQVLDSRWFRLLGLTTEQVIDLLYAANRAGALGFHMQADVVELTLPPVVSE